MWHFLKPAKHCSELCEFLCILYNQGVADSLVATVADSWGMRGHTVAELCNVWYVTAKGSLQHDELCCRDCYGHFTLKQGARMKHQAITAALTQASSAPILSFSRKERKIFQLIWLIQEMQKNDLHVFLICLEWIPAFTGMLWMLCNWPCNHSSQRGWGLSLWIGWTHVFLS